MSWDLTPPGQSIYLYSVSKSEIKDPGSSPARWSLGFWSVHSCAHLSEPITPLTTKVQLERSHEPMGQVCMRECVCMCACVVVFVLMFVFVCVYTKRLA